jgi:hypothetical protein
MNRFRIVSLAKTVSVSSRRSFSLSAEAKAQYYAGYIPNKIIERLHVDFHTEFRQNEAKYETNSIVHGYKCDVIMRVGGKTINYQVNRPYDVTEEIKKRDELLESKNVIVVRPDISMFDERLLEYMEKV